VLLREHAYARAVCRFFRGCRTERCSHPDEVARLGGCAIGYFGALGAASVRLIDRAAGDGSGRVACRAPARHLFGFRPAPRRSPLLGLRSINCTGGACFRVAGLPAQADAPWASRPTDWQFCELEAAGVADSASTAGFGDNWHSRADPGGACIVVMLATAGLDAATRRRGATARVTKRARRR